MPLTEQELHSAKPSEGIFTPTSLQTFLNCRRQYLIRKEMGLVGKTTSQHLVYGSAFHAGVAEFYRSRDKDKSVKAFSDYWIENGDNVPQDDNKNLQSGLAAMKKYCNCYAHDSAVFKPEYIESPQTIQMPNGTTLGFIMDRVMIKDKFVDLIDTKTSSRPLTDYYFRQWENSFQMSAYAYVCIEMFGSCDNVTIDAVQVPVKGENSFSRRSFFRTELQIQEFLNTYLQITDFIMANIDLPEEERILKFYQEQTRCADYSGCTYLPICQYGLTHPAVQTNFVRG